MEIDKCFHLTIFIRRVTLNTELDTVFLFVRHGQRTHFGVYPLVCPFSTWPGQGFYVELFLLVLLIGFRDGKEAEPFWLKPLLIKEMFYAFSRKNKVFYKISGIDRYLSSCCNNKIVNRIKFYSKMQRR